MNIHPTCNAYPHRQLILKAVGQKQSQEQNQMTGQNRRRTSGDSAELSRKGKRINPPRKVLSVGGFVFEEVRQWQS
jgi:hypothetical protein